MTYRPVKRFELKDDFWGVVFIILAGIMLLNIGGCQSMGYRRGEKDADKYYKGQHLRTWSYPYGYMRGWEYKKLERARESR